MKKKTAIIIVALVIMFFLILISIIPGFKDKITGQIVGELYKKDLNLYDCIETGKWDQKGQDYKLTMCPEDRPIMQGAGIAVTDDSQSGGRVFCCKARNLEIYDCSEESYWEEDRKDYELTLCPTHKPLMMGFGIKVHNDNQAGGKAYCCKGRNVELHGCAITSYWKDSNKDHKLTVCPEDRKIIRGIGIRVKDNNQEGGKAYCCKGRVELKEGEEETEEAEETVADEVNETETVEEESEEVESFFRISIKFFCKLRYPKDLDTYKRCLNRYF